MHTTHHNDDTFAGGVVFHTVLRFRQKYIYIRVRFLSGFRCALCSASDREISGDEAHKIQFRSVVQVVGRWEEISVTCPYREASQ